MSLYSLKNYVSINIIIPMNERRQLGLNIKLARMKKSLTQEQFAEKIDMSLSYVSKVEQGLTTPTALVVFKMAKVLGLSVEELFRDIVF